jgi:hypothetical protein
MSERGLAKERRSPSAQHGARINKTRGPSQCRNPEPSAHSHDWACLKSEVPSARSYSSTGYQKPSELLRPLLAGELERGSLDARGWRSRWTATANCPSRAGALTWLKWPWPCFPACPSSGWRGSRAHRLPRGVRPPRREGRGAPLEGLHPRSSRTPDPALPLGDGGGLFSLFC